MADKPAEMLPYDLAKDMIHEQDIHKMYLRKIDGQLHNFDMSDRCFIPTDNEQLEMAVINYIEKYVNQDSDPTIKVTKKFVQDTVFFIKRYPFQNYQPAEYEGWMGFRNGILNVLNWGFIDYSDPIKPFNPTLFPPITFAFQEAYDTSVQSQLNSTLYERPQGAQYGYTPYTVSQLFPDKTPYFSKFLNRISGGNYILQDRIWEMIGYILTPDTSGKVFFLLQGVPNSGKSILGRLIESFFPQGQVTSLNVNRLGDRFAPTKMNVSRLNLSMDLPDGKMTPTAVANIKMITGGDLIVHEVKYKDAEASRWTCKLLFSTNHPLELRKYDPAFLERIVCIPFQYEIPKIEQDTHLLERLLTEREYILNKALFAYSLLRQKNYCFGGTGQFNPKISYVMDANEIISTFVSECCKFVALEDGRTSTDVLYMKYLQFCKNNNFLTVNKQGFSQRLASTFEGKIQHDKWRDHDAPPLNGYKGIVLISDTSSDSLSGNGNITADTRRFVI